MLAPALYGTAHALGGYSRQTGGLKQRRNSPGCRLLAQAPARRKLVFCCSASDSRDDAGPSGEAAGPNQIPDALPLANSDTDWREFRARLVASQGASTSGAADTDRSGGGGEAGTQARVWAHSIPRPERGCLLVAHPLVFRTQQTYFYQAVVLLLDHGPEGSSGLILNKRTDHRMGEVLGAEMLCPEFADNALYLGGDVNQGTLHLLHTHAWLEGAVEIIGGLHSGGFEAAQEHVRAGKLDPQSMRIFTRMCGWGPGQLESECTAGVWFTAAASASLVLDADAAGAELWHKTLELMGERDPDFSGLSEAMRETYRADIMGKPAPGSDDDSPKP